FESLLLRQGFSGRRFTVASAFFDHRTATTAPLPAARARAVRRPAGRDPADTQGPTAAAPPLRALAWDKPVGGETTCRGMPTGPFWAVSSRSAHCWGWQWVSP